MDSFRRSGVGGSDRRDQLRDMSLLVPPAAGM
jgi:hypothetical protein